MWLDNKGELCIFQYPSREYFVQEYILNGKTREELAKENGVTVATIKTHLYEKRVIKPPVIDTNVLYDLYVNQKKTIKEIASIMGHDRNAISRAITKANIQKQNHYSQYDDAYDDEWIDCYLNDRLSTSQIAALYNVAHNTIKTHLVRCGVPLRGFSQAQRNAHGKEALSSDLDDYNVLYDLYIGQKLDLKQIGEQYGCTAKAIRDKLVANNIPIRSLSETRIGRYVGADHPNWQGGITPLNGRLRQYFDDWLAPAARERDNYQCQLCGSQSNLHVHHIVHFSDIVHQILCEHSNLDPVDDINELYEIIVSDSRFLDINNLITYCKTCHLYKIHNYQRTISNQASQ